MAKNSRQVATNTNNGSGLPTHLSQYKSQGLGVPTRTDEFLIPMARVLDAKSPEVLKGNPNKIPGAEAGDIYIKNAPQPIVKGDKGFIYQPCFRQENVVEWLPRGKGGGGGGGFVAEHPADYLTSNAKDVTQIPHPDDPKRMIWARKSNKNPLVETRKVGGWMIKDNGEAPMPLVLTFQSTGHTVAKQWNMLIASKRINNVPADLFLVYYKVQTRLKSRGDQSWYLFDITDAGPEDGGLPTTMWVPTPQDAERGLRLYEQLSSGQARMASEAPDEE